MHESLRKIRHRNHIAYMFTRDLRAAYRVEYSNIYRYRLWYNDGIHTKRIDKRINSVAHKILQSVCGANVKSAERDDADNDTTTLRRLSTTTTSTRCAVSKSSLILDRLRLKSHTCANGVLCAGVRSLLQPRGDEMPL